MKNTIIIPTEIIKAFRLFLKAFRSITTNSIDNLQIIIVEQNR